MSAPGIQLHSEPRVTYFEPNISQYLQRLEQAVVSNNPPVARQAFEQLDRSVRSLPSAAQPSTQLAEKLQNLGQTLESGDATAARQAVEEFRQQFTSLYGTSPHRVPDTSSSPSANTSEEVGNSNSAHNLNVRI